MASWRYNYILPKPHQTLDMRAAATQLVAAGLSFETECSKIWIDESGLVRHDDSMVQLADPISQGLADLLDSGLNIEGTCRGDDFLMECAWVTTTAWNHIALAWSRKLFGDLPLSRQRYYESAVITAAAAAKAACLIVVLDSPDDMLASFVAIDDRWYVDFETQRGTRIELLAIWQSENGGAGVDELGLQTTGREVAGMREWVVPARAHL